ncbi:MAG: hypothetical protein ACYTDU_13780 [Planctomycetota bacterium]
MKPLILLLPVLILAGCESEFESEGALALAGPAFEEPTQPVSNDPAEVPPEESPPVAEETFVAAVEHPWFPMRPGTLWIYEGDAEGSHRRDDVRVLEQTRVIADVTCTAVRQEVFLDGELSEVTTEWFAQDGDGNVWRFGEETAELDDGVFAATADSWMAGEDGAVPWMFLAADPHVGDRYVGYRPDGQEVVEIVSLTETATVPAGIFENCLEAEENPDDLEDADIILFAPGVGLVSESSHTGRIDLVSVR